MKKEMRSLDVKLKDCRPEELTSILVHDTKQLVLMESVDTFLDRRELFHKEVDKGASVLSKLVETNTIDVQEAHEAIGRIVSIIPNIAEGWGRINTFQAIDAASQEAKEQIKNNEGVDINYLPLSAFSDNPDLVPMAETTAKKGLQMAFEMVMHLIEAIATEVYHEGKRDGKKEAGNE